MQTNLKAAIRQALAGSSSQQPVDVAKLYKVGPREQVEAALLELYHGRQVYCCLYQRGGAKPSSVWWLVGGVSASHSYGKNIAVGKCASGFLPDVPAVPGRTVHRIQG